MVPLFPVDGNYSPTKSASHSIFLDAINLRSSPKKLSAVEPSWPTWQESHTTDSDCEEEDISLNPFAVVRTRPPSPVQPTRPYPFIDMVPIDPISFFEFGMTSYRFPDPASLGSADGPSPAQELYIPTMNSAETWQSPIIFAPEDTEDQRKKWSILPAAGFVYPKESTGSPTTSALSFVTASAFAEDTGTVSTSEATSESEPVRSPREATRQQLASATDATVEAPEVSEAGEQEFDKDLPELPQTPRRAKRIWNRLRSASWKTPGTP